MGWDVLKKEFFLFRYREWGYWLPYTLNLVIIGKCSVARKLIGTGKDLQHAGAKPVQGNGASGVG